MACCILQMGPSARVIDANVKQKRLILASSVVCEESPQTSVVMCIRNGFSLPFRPLALSRKSHVSPTTIWTSGQYLVENPNIVERALSSLCTRYGVNAGGFLTAIFVIIHPNKFRLVMRPQAPA